VLEKRWTAAAPVRLNANSASKPVQTGGIPPLARKVVNHGAGVFKRTNPRRTISIFVLFYFLSQVAVQGLLVWRIPMAQTEHGAVAWNGSSQLRYAISPPPPVTLPQLHTTNNRSVLTRTFSFSSCQGRGKGNPIPIIELWHGIFLWS
jgi:hypothetical protein